MSEITPDLQRLQWIASNLHIITKAGTRELLRPNVVQLRLHMALQAQRRRNLPVRLRILKARQFGISTWLEAEGFYEVYHNSNWNAMAVSVDADSTDHIFRMTKMFEEEMPTVLRKPKNNTNRKEIVYARPHRSRFISQTAGKMSLGRSFTVQYLHDSEAAFWENAALQKSGLEEIVPLKPGTTIADETTANGQGGWFYESWVEDVKRRRKRPDDYSGYLPVFFPWFIFPEYAIEPPPGFAFTKDERDLQRQFHLSEGQLYWRRLKLESKNGDFALLAQEFPGTWEEAFQCSGNPVFSAEIISKQAMYQQTKFRRVLFDEQSGRFDMVDCDEETNMWLIWKPPVDGHDYILACDSMEGRLSDQHNPKSHLDRDSMVVLDRNTGECVALYTGRTDQRELGKQGFRAAVYYNEAWVAPEIPQGMIFLEYLKERGYPYLYNRQRHEDRETETESEVLGWRTTAITRKWLVDDFVVAAKEGAVKVIFPEILDQMRTFVRNANGKPEHLPAEHDDNLFACMIALQAHKRCERSTGAVKQAHTGAPPERYPSENDLARTGAVDTWDPEEGDENDDEALHTS